MSHKILIFTLVFAFQSLGLYAQYGSQKCRWQKLENAAFTLDSLSVDASSIKIEGLEDSSYHYNINSGNLQINAEVKPDSIFVCYRTLPFKLNVLHFNRSLEEYDSNALFKDRPAPTLHMQKKDELFHSPDLHKSGSLSRGISFGNTQNVFVNSALNLQMEGKISEDLNIRAVISDQNIPLQPEGNTQHLQEFDRVFIQVYNDNASLTAGDVVLQNKASHFLRYYKNVQGGQLETKYKISKTSAAETSAGASIAKGKFASTNVPVLEGVLGPYRLRGQENERFIIVLANSEKVFLDGVLLQRGFDYDYVIDYNLGEITFTPKILITKYSRLRVDFEYSERNYSRSIMNASHYQQIGKANVKLNFYSEKDNPHQPLSFELDQDQKGYLSEIGDSLELALIPAFDSVAFSNSRILYKKVTIQLDEVSSTVFIHSNNPDSAKYHLIFSEVGEGKGNYVQTRSNANGRIFEFIAPINGVPQGRFEPVRQIPLPNKKQMATLGADFAISDYDKVFGEMAFSQRDLNRFSKLGNEDDQGKAFHVGYAMEGRKLNFTKKYKLNSIIDYEFNDQHFNPIDRYRFIEFDRDWGFDPMSSLAAEDHIFNWNTVLEKDFNNKFNYKLSLRNRGEDINGEQHHVNISKRIKRIQVSSHNFLMNNRKSMSHVKWFRSFNDIHYISKYLVPGYGYRVDKNTQTSNETGAILSTVMNYDEHKIYLRSNDSLKTSFDLNHNFRVDNDTLNNILKPSTRANTTNFSFNTDIKQKHNLNFLLTYRNLEHLNSSDADLKKMDEETIMGRVDWNGSMLKKHIRSELTYAVGNGRELKKEFVYLQVPTGEGTHTWRDDNGDNIQDLNEFYEAINADERNYARIFVPTDEYIIAFSNNFNYRLSLEMPRSWKTLRGLKGFASRFSNNTYWTIDNKVTDAHLANRLIPFNSVEEENLISTRKNLRSTFFYNRTNPKFGMDGGLLKTENKQLLTNGFETNKNEELRINTRYNIQKTYNLGFLSVTSLRSSLSDFLEGRNYSIKSYRFSPEIAWQPTNTFRITGTYSTQEKKNIFAPEATEKAHFDEFSLDFRVSKASSGTFNALIRYINIDFEGVTNTPVGYALLDALQPGNNLTWSLNLQQKITSGLQMNINYEGRKSGEVGVVHIGSMQVSALF